MYLNILIKKIDGLTTRAKLFLIAILGLALIIVVLLCIGLSRGAPSDASLPTPPSRQDDSYQLRVQNDKTLQSFLNKLRELGDKATPADCGSAGCFTPEIENLKRKMNAAGYVEIHYPIDCDAVACSGAWAQKNWPEAAAYDAHKIAHWDQENLPNLINLQAKRYNDEYKENEVAADDKYKGKALELQGDVVRVGKAYNGERFIALNAGEYAEVAIYGVSEQEAIGLRRGQNVTVKCVGDGMILQIATCKIKP